jgi:peptidyl-tRNA hydrolase
MQCAQSAHAAFQFAVEHPEITSKWHEESSYLICLGVENETELLIWSETAHDLGVKRSLMREPDLGGQATSLAIAPSPHWKLFSQLPLLGREEVVV